MIAHISQSQWLMLASLLLLGPAVFWANEPADRRLHHPLSPLDLTLFPAAQQWIFLAEARSVIPPRASITVRARDANDEMGLFMFALGLYTKNVVIPHSYWGESVQSPPPADYVLSFKCEATDDPGVEVAALPYGCIRRRSR